MWYIPSYVSVTCFFCQYYVMWGDRGLLINALAADFLFAACQLNIGLEGNTPPLPPILYSLLLSVNCYVCPIFFLWVRTEREVENTRWRECRKSRKVENARWRDEQRILKLLPATANWRESCRSTKTFATAHFFQILLARVITKFFLGGENNS